MLDISPRKILVTGGAGYIGAHTARALAAQGFEPIVFDNLSSGHRRAVRWGELVEGDIRDGEALERTFGEHSIDAVIHFAGLIEVGRSVAQPELFWDVNVGGTTSLLRAMRNHGVKRLVFSSSAAVYGPTASPTGLIAEEATKAPSSPYGDTKLAGERLIEACCRAHGLKAVALRYFNAGGADADDGIGEAHHPETHLIPLAIAAALGGAPLTLFGDDFETPDGTCRRDYVHVRDLAAAHLAALQVELAPGAFKVANIGGGLGHSVRDVIACVERTLGRPVPHTIGPRRPGDPPSLVADPRYARAMLGWEATASSLDRIVADAAKWAMQPAFGPMALTAAHPEPD